MKYIQLKQLKLEGIETNLEFFFSTFNFNFYCSRVEYNSMSSDGFSGVKNCHQEPKATLFVSLCGHNWIWGRTGGTLPRGEGDHIWFLALVCPTFSKLFLKASNYRKKYFTLTSKDRLFICSIWRVASSKLSRAKIPSSCHYGRIL